MRSFLILMLFLFSLNTFAQETHDVTIVGFAFSPAEITIPVNDIVRWTNDGGLHNVIADNGSFNSGAVSSSLWVFTHTFTTPGDFRYFCDAHGGPNGVGMAGIVHVQPSTGVDDEINKIEFILNQNYPNPFNPKTVIGYTIPEGANVVLKVFNVTGSLEKTLISEFQPAGNYLVEFNSEGLTSGIYFYQLIAGDFVSTKRMVLLK